MTKRSRVLSFVPMILITAFATPPPVHGDEQSLKERVLTEYPRAIDALQAHFAHVSGSGRETYHQNIGQPSERNWTHTVEFARSGDQAKCVADWGPAEAPRDEPSKEDADKKTTSKSAPAPRRRPSGQIIRCYNQEDSLELYRANLDKPYELKYLEPRINLHQEKKNDPVKLVVDRDLGFLNCAFDTNIHKERFKNPNFSIDRVTEKKSTTDKLLLKVDYSTKIDPQAKNSLRPGKPVAILNAGSFTVSPTEKWVLYEYELWIRFPNGAYRLDTRRVEYEGQVDGVPTPKRVVTQAFGMPQGKDPSADGRPPVRIPIEEKTFEFTKLQFGPVPNREFTLAAYKLPEINKPSPRVHTSRVSYWFVGIAIVTLTAGLLLRYYATRQRSVGGPD